MRSVTIGGCNRETRNGIDAMNYFAKIGRFGVLGWLRDRSQEDSMIRGKASWSNGFETAEIGDVALFLGSVFVAHDPVDDTRNRPRRRAINSNEIHGNGVRDFRMTLDHRNAILWFAEITFKHPFRVRDGYDARNALSHWFWDFWGMFLWQDTNRIPVSFNFVFTYIYMLLINEIHRRLSFMETSIPTDRVEKCFPRVSTDRDWISVALYLVDGFFPRVHSLYRFR